MCRPAIVFACTFLLIALTACQSTGPTAAPTAKNDQPAATASAAPPAGGAAQTAPADAAKAQTDKAEQLKKQTKLERELKLARLALDKTKLTQEYAELTHKIALAKAQLELELALKRYEVYEKEELPVRLARADLGMKYNEDSLKEAIEEYDQLKKMYEGEQIADATKEIVLERSARRLERTKENLALAKKEMATLKEKTIPFEQRERKQQVEDKSNALEQINRDWKVAGIDRQVAMINAEAEIARLEDELATLNKEIEKGESKPAAKESAK